MVTGDKAQLDSLVHERTNNISLFHIRVFQVDQKVFSYVSWNFAHFDNETLAIIFQRSKNGLELLSIVRARHFFLCSVRNLISEIADL